MTVLKERSCQYINMKYLRIQVRRIQVHFRRANQNCRIARRFIVYYGFAVNIMKILLRYDIVRYCILHGVSS